MGLPCSTQILKWQERKQTCKEPNLGISIWDSVGTQIPLSLSSKILHRENWNFIIFLIWKISGSLKKGYCGSKLLVGFLLDWF